ncbi:MAG: LysE family translocator [Kineosporiaceae bacterium]
MTTAALLAWLTLVVGLTLLPGADTMLVLRAAVRDGTGPAVAAGAGVSTGTVIWGAAASAGLASVVASSPVAYDLLRWFGAAYLVLLGLRSILSRGRGLGADLAGPPAAASSGPSAPEARAVVRGYGTGLVTNLLNPKIGVFYLSLLPQFLPPGGHLVVWGMLLSGIHAVLGLVWFALVAAGVGRARRLLSRRRVVRTVESVVGVALVGFGVRVAAAAS